MSPAQLKEVARHWYEDVLSGTVTTRRRKADGYMDISDEKLSLVFAPDYVNHVLPAPPGGWKTGVEAAKQIIHAYRLSFPDLTVEVQDQKVVQDLVITHYTAGGTHMAKAFLGAGATGRAYRVQGYGIDRIADGKFAESWGSWDICSLLEQMGVLPKDVWNA
jgi:predicted ester cyclase